VSAARLWLRALRLPFATASLLPYVYGAAIAGGAFRAGRFALGLVAVLATHLAANLINDVADSASGADWQDLRSYRFFGGSKVIQEGRLSARACRRAAAALAVLAALSVLALAWQLERPALLAGLAAALLLGWGYSCPPLQLSYRRLGEATVFLLFGPAAVALAVFAQVGRPPAPGQWLLSLPFGFMTAGILLANEVPDCSEDAAVGKRTLVGWIGCERGFVLFGAAAAAAYLLIVAGVLLGMAGELALLALGTLPLVWRAAGILRRRCRDKAELVRSSRLAVAAHALAGLALIADAWTWRGSW